MVERVTVAVDANGADLGPGEVARGAAIAAERGIDVVLFGPAGELAGAGVEVVDAPVSIAKAADPARAVRSTPEASIVQAVEAVASGRADALVSGGSTGAALAASLFRFKRARGVHRPALAIVVPVPGRAVPAARRRRQRRRAARAPRPVRAHGRRVHGGRDGVRAPARGAALQRRGALARAGGRRRRPRGAERAPGGDRLRRQRRGVRRSARASATCSSPTATRATSR